MPRSDAQDKNILLSPAGELVGSGVRAATVAAARAPNGPGDE